MLSLDIDARVKSPFYMDLGIESRASRDRDCELTQLIKPRDFPALYEIINIGT